MPNTDLDPAKETFPPTFTTDNFLQVDDGSQVSQGRYCWTVWPVIEDPAHPGQIWNRQPRVDKYPPFCYTSGPSFPNIKFAKSTVKAGEQIDGTIEWDYVPDGQLTISSIASPATLVTSLAKCRSRGPYYADKYNCVIRFAAIAQKGMFSRSRRKATTVQRSSCLTGRRPSTTCRRLWRTRSPLRPRHVAPSAKSAALSGSIAVMITPWAATIIFAVPVAERGQVAVPGTSATAPRTMFASTKALRCVAKSAGSEERRVAIGGEMVPIATTAKDHA